MIKVLITGGSGFIGTNLIRFLLERGSYKVKSVDLATPKIESHKAVWECVDIRDNGALAILFEVFSPDMVVHLAARTDLRGATLEDYDSNTLGVENLIAVIKKTPSVKRVLFASSMYVCRPGYQPADMDDYDPHTVYGESKMLTERIIKGAELSVPWVIFRPTSIWGPWFSEPYIDFFKIVLGRKYFHLGKRACSKTYGYIENSVRQIEVLLEADIDRVNGRLFYIGDWPAYNISEWAEESVLNQTYRNVNVIVVDDNCNGDEYRKMTESVMDSYFNNNRVKYIKHDNNLNGAAARNTGIHNTGAEYISFLDDDDFYLPHKIERQVQILDGLGEEYGGCCCFHIRRYKKFAYRTYSVEPNKTGDFRFEFLSGKTSMPTSTLLFRAEVFRKIGGFDEAFARHQDLEFLMRFFSVYKIGISPFFDVVMQVEGYRNYPDSESAHKIKNQFLSKYDSDLRMFSEAQLKIILKHQWFEVACIYLKDRRIKASKLLFDKYVFGVDPHLGDYIRIISFVVFGIFPFTWKLSTLLLGITKYRKFYGSMYDIMK